MAGRGYRIVRSHPCKTCGKPAWGTRVLCDKCWGSLPDVVKEKILTRAMQQDIGLDVTDFTPHGPPMKRLAPREWDEQPY